MKKHLFEKTVENPTNADFMVIVDEEKTSRHYGLAEISLDQTKYSYMKIYKENIRSTSATTRNNSLHLLEDRLIPLIFFERGGKKSRARYLKILRPEYLRKKGHLPQKLKGKKTLQSSTSEEESICELGSSTSQQC